MAMTLITTNTSSDAASSSFTSSIDSTYKLYIFKFYDLNPVTDDRHFSFQGSIDSGSNYNVAMTTTYFWARHTEAGDATGLAYNTSRDQAQGTDFQNIIHSVGSGSDESCAGELFLFNPSNTTYVKHFFSRAVENEASDQAVEVHAAGYFNTTSAIDAIQFKFEGGATNFDGVISMYGVG